MDKGSMLEHYTDRLYQNNFSKEGFSSVVKEIRAGGYSKQERNELCRALAREYVSEEAGYQRAAMEIIEPNIRIMEHMDTAQAANYVDYFNRGIRDNGHPQRLKELVTTNLDMAFRAYKESGCCHLDSYR